MKTGQLGMRIKEARGRKGMSQEEVASKAGIHRVTLANIERGAKTPTLDTLERLAKALELPLRKLLE
jgi:transcriptional regulator with XRE-family HTH domain